MISRRVIDRAGSHNTANEIEQPVSGRGDLEILAREAIGALGLKVTVRDAELQATPQVVSTFVDLNMRREATGLMGYYDAVRFLPVTLPKQRHPGGPYEMEVVRVDYSLIALVSDPVSPATVRESVMRRISRLPNVDPAIRSEWREGRVGLLGTQLCLITSDRKILLRRRGVNVLFARNRWDVSVSGFCGTVDLDGESILNPCLTAEHETLREIGHVRADPRNLRMLGVVRNTNTGAFDILLAWETDSDSRAIMKLLTAKNARENTVFDTGVRAIERYVWDSKNLLVNLDAEDMEFAWDRCGVKAEDFEPQSLLCLDLTLRMFASDREHGFLRQGGPEN